MYKLQFIDVLCPTEKVGIAVGIVTRRWDGRPRNRVPFAARSETFISSSTKDQTGSRLLAQWAWGTYAAVKTGFTTSTVEGQERGAIPPIPPYIFTAWYFIIRYLLISGR